MRTSIWLVVGSVVMLGCSAEQPNTPPPEGSSATSSEGLSTPPGGSSTANTSSSENGSDSTPLESSVSTTEVTSQPNMVWPGPRRARRISSNEYATCVIRPDQTVACWGSPGVSAGQGMYKEVSGAGYFGSDFCGLRTDGTLKCFVGGYTNDFVPQEGTYKNVFVSLRMACAQKLDDTLVCWGQPENPDWLNAPTEPLTKVSAGFGSGCGFAEDGTMRCWGNDGAVVDGKRLEPDRADYRAFYIGGTPCGMLEAGSIGCWSLFLDQTVPSREGYVQVASTPQLICAVHMDGHVDCEGAVKDEWGSSSKPYPSTKKFEEVSVGGDFVCGITTEQDVECWGGSDPGTTTVPAGLKAIALENNPE